MESELIPSNPVPDLPSSPTPYIEPTDKLDAPTRDMHRGLAALIETLQAVDHYIQRYDACTDPELRLIIAHHRDQQKAQAAMLLEWVRRRDVRFDHELKQALFKAGPITAFIKS